MFKSVSQNTRLVPRPKRKNKGQHPGHVELMKMLLALGDQDCVCNQYRSGDLFFIVVGLDPHSCLFWWLVPTKITLLLNQDSIFTQVECKKVKEKHLGHRKREFQLLFQQKRKGLKTSQLD